MQTIEQDVDANNAFTTIFGIGGPVTSATVTASGTWSWDPHSGRSCGAGGNGLPASAGSPCQGPEGCLVFKVLGPIGVDGHPQIEQIGWFTSDTQTITFTTKGEYQFQINDNNLGDNGHTKLHLSGTLNP